MEWKFAQNNHNNTQMNILRSPEYKNNDNVTSWIHHCWLYTVICVLGRIQLDLKAWCTKGVCCLFVQCVVCYCVSVGLTHHAEEGVGVRHRLYVRMWLEENKSFVKIIKAVVGQPKSSVKGPDTDVKMAAHYQFLYGGMFMYLFAQILIKQSKV